MTLNHWVKSGLFTREIALYHRLLRRGVGVTFVSYGSGSDLKYHDQMPGIRLICNRWRLPNSLYIYLLYNILPQFLPETAVIKSNQVLGADIAMRAARRFGRHFVARCGYLQSEIVELDYGKDSLQSHEAQNFERNVFNGADRVKLHVASIADDRVLAGLSNDFDYVFHLATYHGNQSSIANPLADHDNNLITTLKLYENLKNFQRLKRVVYVSTGCALAEKAAGPVKPVLEDGPIPLDFDSPYQISKVVGEMYSLYYHRTHGLPVVRARFQNVYGPGEMLGAGKWRGTPATIWRNVVPTFVYRAIKKQPLSVHGKGESTRDFIYVDDIVEGLIRCALTPGTEGDVFNLASGEEVSIFRLAETINNLTNNPAGIEFIPPRDWDRSINRVGSPEKSRHRLGFEASVPLEVGLARTVAWTQENLTRIERCIGQHAEFCSAEF